MSDLERRIRALEDVEAIKRLKYRYWRHLDLKQWDELADCFAADATVSYGDGRYRFAGVEAIMRFLRESLARETGSVTIHHGHHPEIELTGETRARGRRPPREHDQQGRRPRPAVLPSHDVALRAILRGSATACSPARRRSGWTTRSSIHAWRLPGTSHAFTHRRSPGLRDRC